MSAQRETCGDVPYWRVAALVDLEGRGARLTWSVREDRQETAAFSLVDATGASRGLGCEVR